MRVDAERLWRARYEALVGRLPAISADAQLTLCGLSACVDARVDMHDMEALLSPEAPPEAVYFAEKLIDRAGRGIGGEFHSDWSEGPQWLSTSIPIRYALGGTGPHAASTLVTMGAPAAVALEDRSAHMLAQVPADILLADGDSFRPAGEVAPDGNRRPEMYIFEYSAGRPIRDVTPPRSSRIIVRFSDPGLENDAGFDRLSVLHAPRAGAGLISGFNSVPAAMLQSSYKRVRELGQSWLRAGVGTVHLELAGYDSEALCLDALEALRGAYNSVGMSESEYRRYFGEGPLGEGLVALGRRLGIARVCVHADGWAASATRNDPARELEALMSGCLAAASRAAAGRLVFPTSISPDAHFDAPPYSQPVKYGEWTVVSCATPHLKAPETTLGLGDTFTGGCLLVLGGRQAARDAGPEVLASSMA